MLADTLLTYDQIIDRIHPELRDHVRKTELNTVELDHWSYTGSIDAGFIFDRVNTGFTGFATKRDQFLADAEWLKFVASHPERMRVMAFDQIASNLNQEDYCQTLVHLWYEVENAFAHFARWRKLWADARVDRDLIMNPDDQAAFAKLPEAITVYRGHRSIDAGHGLSWTIDKTKAEWFANRWKHRGGEPVIIKRQVQKDRVKAMLTGRNETELVIDPDDLA